MFTMRQKRWCAIAGLILITIISPIFSPSPTILAQTTKQQIQYEKRNLTLGAFYSPGHPNDPMFLACEKFAQLVDKYTDGRVKVTHSGEGQVYASGAEMVKAAMIGSLDIVWTPQSRYTETGLKSWGIFSIPGLLTAGGGNEKRYGERLNKFSEDSEVRAILSKEAKSKGLKFFSVTADFPLHLVAKKPYSASELKGLKLALPGALGYRLLGQKYGVAMVPMVATGERYSALKQGMVEGILPTTKFLSLTYKWTEVAPYLMTEPLATVVETLQISMITWNSFTPKLQALLEKNVIPEATGYSRSIFIHRLKQLDDEYKKGGGKEYSWTEKELSDLRAWFPQLAEAFRNSLGNDLVNIALKYQ